MTISFGSSPHFDQIMLNVKISCSFSGYLNSLRCPTLNSLVLLVLLFYYLKKKKSRLANDEKLMHLASKMLPHL